ncbi:MAG: hypothetical protein IRY94_17180 [Rhodospirillaceae bacterium]|nr:hypothetical protein [Rhodospirillaceae bacterium]
MSPLGHLTISLAPLIPWPAIAGLGGAALVLLALAVGRRARGTLWRAIAFAVLVAALLNPSVVQEERQSLSDVAVVVVDDSQSQQIEGRPQQTAEALERIEASIKALPDTDLRVVHAGATQPGSQEEGTHLFGPLARALADLPGGRIAGIMVLSDGEIHDVPADLAKLGYDAPVHLLLTGRPDEGDRRLTLVRAPSFGLVGKPVTMTLRVDDLTGPRAPASAGGSADVTLTRDGERLATMPVEIGKDVDISVPLDHAGQTVFEFSVERGPKELSLANNAVVAAVSGVRDRMRVLLVSGEPHPGERTWRNLLKSDPSVDLVHFTILRPPEKQDGTPINELSLIAFPIRELFEIKLDQFDLIVFDRYRNRGVLPPAYFQNILEYVRKGGALLDSAGESFAGPQGLYYSPLAEMLPAEPTGKVIHAPFRPQVTDLGRRHPVTAPLAGPPGQAPSWGRWFRQVDAIAPQGTTVMSGADGRPLLVLQHYGEGRVAQLLSDQIWLWSRGYEGGGPQAELLRRIAHWLMKEPELEEENLEATVVNGRLEVTRRSLSTAPATVEVTGPDGKTQRLTLEAGEKGVSTVALPAPEQGLYRVSDGTHTAFAASGPLNPLELADLRATEEPMKPLVTASGGSIHWLAEDGIPSVRKVREGRDTAGRHWIGLRSKDQYLVQGIRQVPLLPAFAVLLAGLGALLLAWRREGR